MRKRTAMSPVIASVILAGMVLAVGATVWSYSLGAATTIAESYVNDTLSLLDELTERFSVEHVHYDKETDEITIWVNNFGDVNVIVDVYVVVEGHGEKSVTGVNIDARDYKSIDFSYDPSLDSGNLVSIKVYSRRQNIVYDLHSIP